MPVQLQTVEVSLFEGLSQKSNAKTIPQGKLIQADNVEYDKSGTLNKRKGYLSVGLTTEAFGNTPEEIFLGVCTYEDELVIIGYDRGYAVGDRIGSLPGTRSIVQRGALPRGNTRIQDVAGGRVGGNVIIPG